MPWEDSLARMLVRAQARRARESGEIADGEFPLRPAGTVGIQPRDKAEFEEMTGLSLLGFELIGEMET